MHSGVMIIIRFSFVELFYWICLSRFQFRFLLPLFRGFGDRRWTRDDPEFAMHNLLIGLEAPYYWRIGKQIHYRAWIRLTFNPLDRANLPSRQYRVISTGNLTIRCC